jgi:DNA-binding transcriptional ArsR family regulator
MKAGWTVLPSIILEKQHALGLDAVDINILLQLAYHWWFHDNPPHLSKATIATRIQVHPSTVRRHIARMEKDELIKREKRFKDHGGQSSNFYRFDGLIKSAIPHAREVNATCEQRKQEDISRGKRKRPRTFPDKAAAKDGAE